MTPEPHSPLAAFDSLERGHPAPAWLTEGIGTSWVGEGARMQTTLIAVSENATFRVDVDDAPRLVVRLSRPGYVGDAANIESELLWVEAISQDTDLRTAAPVRGRNGELIQHIVDADSTSWTAVAFTFVRGSILEDVADPTPHFVEIGALTAQLHVHARTWQRPAGFTRFAWGFRDMVGDEARWGSWERATLSPAAHGVLERAQSLALAEVAGLSQSGSTWGLIHADLRPSNLMSGPDGLTVIDFDDAGFGWYLYDFASALTFYEHRPAALEMAAGWLAGYRSVLPLERPALRTAGALSMLRRLTMLGWASTHREDALPAELWQENLPGTVDVARRYLDDPLWLVDPQ